MSDTEIHDAFSETPNIATTKRFGDKNRRKTYFEPVTKSPMLTLHSGRQSLQDLRKNYHMCKSSYDQEIDSDKRLLSWNKWLEERKNVHKNLALATNRTPSQLVMNTTECYRSKLEDAILIDYASSMNTPGASGENLTFWTIPVHIMPRKCKCTCGENMNLAPIQCQLSKLQKCPVSSMEYITVPDKVLMEKGISDLRTCRQKWLGLPYRQQRRKELSKKIEALEPHKPDLSEIMIEGHSFLKAKPKATISTIFQIPVITVSSPVDFLEDKPSDQPVDDDFDTYNDLGVITLKIDNIKFDKFFRNTNLLEVIELRVNIVTEINTVAKKYVTFLNQGTVVIRCKWRAVKSINPENLPVHIPNEKIIFDTCSFMVLPGQIHKVLFMVHPGNVGILTEIWALETEPSIVKKDTSINVCFWVFANEKASTLEPKPEINPLEIVPEECSKTCTSEFSVNYLQPCGWVSEEHQFYLANLDECAKHPQFFYQKSGIETLKQFYQVYKPQSFPENWDLSIKTLSKLAQKETDYDRRKELLIELNAKIYPMRFVSDQSMNLDFRKYQTVYNILVATIDRIVKDIFDTSQMLNIVLPDSKYPEALYTGLSDLFHDPNKHLYSCREIDCITANKTIEENLRCSGKYPDRQKEWCQLPPLERFAKQHDIPLGQPEKPTSKNKRSKKKVKPEPKVPSTLDITSRSESVLTVDQTFPLSPITSLLAFHDPFDNLNVFNEIIFIKTRERIKQAIDDITASIEACHVNMLEKPFMFIQKIYQAEKSMERKNNSKSEISFQKSVCSSLWRN